MIISKGFTNRIILEVRRHFKTAVDITFFWPAYLKRFTPKKRRIYGDRWEYLVEKHPQRFLIGCYTSLIIVPLIFLTTLSFTLLSSLIHFLTPKPSHKAIKISKPISSLKLHYTLNPDFKKANHSSTPMTISPTRVKMRTKKSMA